jgi:hypothetical protein
MYEQSIKGKNADNKNRTSRLKAEEILVKKQTV